MLFFLAWSHVKSLNQIAMDWASQFSFSHYAGFKLWKPSPKETFHSLTCFCQCKKKGNILTHQSWTWDIFLLCQQCSKRGFAEGWTRLESRKAAWMVRNMRHMMCNYFMSLNNIQLLDCLLPNFHPLAFPVCHFNSKTEKVHFKALTGRNICIKPFFKFCVQAKC